MCEPESLHRVSALDRLGQALGELRVRRALPYVTGAGPGQVPLGGRDQDGHGDKAGQHEQRADQDQGTEGDGDRQQGDQRFRDRVPDGGGQRAHVPRGTGHQIAAVGVLDGVQVQGEHVADELLAQFPEDAFTQYGRRIHREPDERRLCDAGQADQQHIVGDVVPAAGHRGDQIAQQPRHGESGRRRKRVHGDDTGQAPWMARGDPPGVSADFLRRRDRQRVHAVPISRVTSERYRASSSI